MTADLLEYPAPALETPPDDIREMDSHFVMGTYARQPVTFVRGCGALLWDSDGREYLDFLGGIAVVLVGHCHPDVTRAISEQAARLTHISNIFHNDLQPRLARRLCSLAGMEKAFFCNSGAEANECAIKIARKWGKAQRGDECAEIVSFDGSFHGRTYGSLSATAQPKYQAPFRPIVPGFTHSPLNDLEALRARISNKTCAIIVEPIQGESGIHVATPEFLRGVRALCDEVGALLIFDEVQCGMGRSGKFLASDLCGVRADVVTLAKGIANGFPMGACLARGTAAHTLVPGDHGSTFGGQPLACAAALATLDVLDRENLIANAADVGGYFADLLRTASDAHPGRIREIRGAGLMIGVELEGGAARDVARNLLEMGVVVNAIGDSVLRLVPPLVVTREQCAHVAECLIAALESAA